MKFDLKKYYVLCLKILIALTGLFVAFFVAYKSAVTSFTHDESFTYLHYVHQKFLHILSFKSSYTNDHILNTLLMKYAEKLFGSSELALRLPNILALITYMVIAFKLFFEENKNLALPFFVFMTFDPFLLDFFGLARGYGLSIGLMVLSLYFLIRYFKTLKNTELIFFNAGALLSVLSNFTLLNFYVVALVTFNIILLFDFRFRTGLIKSPIDFLKRNKINFFGILVSIIVLFEPIRRLAKNNVLDYGGKDGLLDTLKSQVYNTFYNTPISGSLRDLLTKVIICILILNFLIIIISFLINEKSLIRKYRGLIISNLVIILILTATVVQHFLFDYDFQKDRFALYLYPLIIINAFYLFAFVSSTIFKYLSVPLAFILIPLFAVNLVNNLNARSYKDWKYDMDTKQMLVELENEIIPESKQVQLGVDWLFEPTVNFYRETQNLNWLKPVERSGVNETDDYFYIMKKDMDQESKVVFITEDGKGVLIKNSNFTK